MLETLFVFFLGHDLIYSVYITYIFKSTDLFNEIFEKKHIKREAIENVS
jgi:hypothetical protein